MSSGTIPPSSLVLPAENNVASNWSNSGLAAIGGIPTRNTQCGATVTPSGLTPPVANDDAVKVTAAIAACTAGQFIQLGAGTFNFANSELPIIVDKSITIRGSGSPVGTCNAATGTPCWPTVLQTYDGPQPKYTTTPQCGVTIGSTSNCPNASGMFQIGPLPLFSFGWAGCQWPASAINPTTNNCGTLLAADVAQGATTVQVAQTSSFTVGGWVLIDEAPVLQTTTNPIAGQASFQASAEFLNTTPGPVTMRVANPDAGLCTYTFCVNRVNQEIHKVTAKGAGPCPGVNCTLTFDSPLTMAFRQSGSHDGRVYWSTNFNTTTPVAFLEQAGFENMTIHRSNGGALNYIFCAYCWAKNVEVNYWIGGAINTNGAVRNQFTGNYLHDCIDCQNNGNEYPVGISSASTEILLDNNIITFGGKGLVGRAANSTVVAYNYVDKTFYEALVIGDWFLDMGVNGSHYAGTHHFLFEGNWGDNCDGDETHGNAIYHTFFRNHCTSMRSTFVDPSNSLTVNDCGGIGFASPSNTPQTPGPLRAAGPMAFNYWYAFVGNALGISGMQSCAVGAFPYNGISGGVIGNQGIWLSGWTGGEWGNHPDPNLSGVNSPQFIFRHGNYDYVNAAIADWTTGFTHTLPNSLYLSVAPSYFGPGASCTYPWPWIDSQASPPVKANSCAGSGLPAKARFDAGTPFTQP